MNTFTIFHTIWSNPDTTIYRLVKYLLKMCDASSTTWTNHLNLLAQKYELPCLLRLMEEQTVWSSASWKSLVETKVTIYHEKMLRYSALKNSKMQYLNVQLSGLTGQPHPALRNILTTQDVKKLRLHLKFLTGDYLHAERLALDQPHLSPACKLCSAAVESTEHVLTNCIATAECRRRILPELLQTTVAAVQPMSHVITNPTSPNLTQFLLDCTSINLDQSLRVPAHNPKVSDIFKVTRDWCFAVNNERLRLLKQIKL